MSNLLRLILLPLAFAMLGASIMLAGQQQLAPLRYQPISITVLSAAVQKLANGTSWPIIRYRYVVNHQAHISEQLTWLEGTWLGRASADFDSRALVARFDTARIHTGYIDPSDATRSYLLREASFDPYLPGLLATMIIGFVAGTKGKAHRDSTIIKSEGWRELAPAQGSAVSLSHALWVQAGTVLTAFVIAGAHFVVLAHGRFGDMSGAGLALGTISLGPCLLASLFDAGAPSRWLAAPRVRIDRKRCHWGENLRVNITQAARGSRFVRVMHVGIVCERVERRSLGRAVTHPYEVQFRAVEDRVVETGEVMEAEYSVHLPQQFSQDGVGPESRSTRYTWRITVQTHVGCPRPYEAQFPLKVEARPQKRPDISDSATARMRQAKASL